MKTIIGISESVVLSFFQIFVTLPALLKTCVSLPRLKKTRVTGTLIGANIIKAEGVDTTVSQSCHRVPGRKQSIKDRFCTKY